MWVDTVPLSRPKRNISRDFADGVLYAELVHHYFPKLVELHNYSAANSTQQKMYNWKTLNQKVLKRLGLRMETDEVTNIANAVPGAVEQALMRLKRKMDEHMARREAQGSDYASDDYAAAAAGAGDDDDGASGPTPEPAKRAGAGAGARRGGANRSISQAATDTSSAGAAPGRRAAAAAAAGSDEQHAIDTELLVEKERTIVQLREIIKILERKMMKLEKLVELKNEKIQALQDQLARK